MRKTLTLVSLASALNIFAQFPPIDLEWSALRAYDGIYGDSRITRDPTSGNYTWAVYQFNGGVMDEMLFPFLPDGTDVTPLYPFEMNVGSLDHLVEIEARDGTLYNLMRHTYLSGVMNWHLRSTAGTDDWDVWLPNPIDPEYSQRGLDMLVSNSAVYTCGYSQTSSSGCMPRVLKTDLQGNILWDEIWDPGGPDSYRYFSTVAEVGDTVVCAFFPNVVLFNASTGTYISTVDPYQGNPGLSGDAWLIARGTRIYWTMTVPVADSLHVGWFDLASGQSDVWSTSLPVQDTYYTRIVIDQFDHIWVSCNTVDAGHWFRLDLDLSPIDSGTLYDRIDDMTITNGKISFTGRLDAAGTVAYVITGLPQP
jgi:hypothetical protein